MACEVSGRSSLSCFHWFLLYIYGPLQLKLLLINDFIDSSSEGKMNNPRMQSLNISVKFRHVKYFFLNLFNKPKALVTQSSNLIFLSGNALVFILSRGSRCISARGFSGVF